MKKKQIQNCFLLLKTSGSSNAIYNIFTDNFIRLVSLTNTYLR